MSALQSSLFVCVHAGPSHCVFPLFLPHVGCFDKQTLTDAGAPCTNSLEALDRSYSKCLGTADVFQSTCSPATNSPARTPTLPPPPPPANFCVILAAPELLRI